MLKYPQKSDTLNMNDPESWYIVKRPQGSCDILAADTLQKAESTTIVEKWGPYNSSAEAIARRVGLIRAGKCQPQ